MNRNTILGTLGVSLLLILTGMIYQEEASYSNQIQPNSTSSKLLAAQTTTGTNMSQIVAANNRFGFSLFNQIQNQTPNSNLVISPHSIAIALAMIRNGAEGETLVEMTAALALSELESAGIDSSYLQLREILTNADSEVQLAISNSLWLNENVTLKEQFINNVQKFYQARVSNLNFASSAAEKIINRWVAKNTAGKIDQIIDATSPQDALYLLNAIYFKGNWTNQFDFDLTTEEPFYISPETTQPQAMMSQTGDYRYYANDNLQAIRLPYGDQEELSMYIFLPQQNSSLQDFNQRLSIENWNEWLSQMRSHKGKISLPSFKLEYETELQDALAGLGMKTMFDAAEANFEQITDTSLAISKVKHKTFIEVNEKGTEAAGVTSVGIRITSAKPLEQPFEMNVNRPFFFAIRDDITETILFMGNVVDP